MTDPAMIDGAESLRMLLAFGSSKRVISTTGCDHIHIQGGGGIL